MIHEVLSGKTIDEVVIELMEPKNLKVEYRKEGKWQEQNVKDSDGRS